jgi:pyridoxal/pyridoxine/pyridoxamine kinase
MSVKRVTIGFMSKAVTGPDGSAKHVWTKSVTACGHGSSSPYHMLNREVNYTHDHHENAVSHQGSTVGAGDSFTAALSLGLLAGWPLEQAQRRASEVAAYVCSQRGATPELPAQLRAPFLLVSLSISRTAI